LEIVPKMTRFPQGEVDNLLRDCQRRFCDVKIELDQIVPKSEGGSDTIDNAIAVCLSCHADIHAYNDRHPRGRKYHPNELKKHRSRKLSNLHILFKFWPDYLSKWTSRCDSIRDKSSIHYSSCTCSPKVKNVQLKLC
jgi:hypothetical protein